MDLNSVQPENQFFFDALDICCQKIIEKIGDKPIPEWRSADYNSLSAKLGKQTKVYLSENTLKRIFGRLKTSERYFPQKATRDALAQFINYRDWLEFEKVCQVSRAQHTKPVVPDPDKELELPIAKKKIKTYLLIGIPFTVLMAIIAGVIFLKSEYAVPDVKLVCENPFGNVPHTAVFKLTSKTNFDKKQEFQVDFLDEAQRADINGDRKITRFFRNPGVVYATLLYHNKPIDTTSVFLHTKGWVANSGNDTSRAFPIAGLKALNPKNIYVSPKQLDSAGLDISKPFLVGFSNIKPSNISGDNFSFSCKVFAEQSRPGTQCIETTIIILGEKHRHLLKLFRPSCVAFSEYKFSEIRSVGSEHFMGTLGFDPENGGTIAIRIENKKVSVILNGKNVLSTKYQRSIGRIMGLKILFNGIGKVISPELRDLKTGEVF